MPFEKHREAETHREMCLERACLSDRVGEMEWREDYTIFFAFLLFYFGRGVGMGRGKGLAGSGPVAI